MDSTEERRQAATHHDRIANTTINVMFDCSDELRDALTALASCATGADSLRAVHELPDRMVRVEQLVAQLIDAAAAALAYRTKTELAADIATRTTLLFPRTDTAVQRATAPPDPAVPQ